MQDGGARATQRSWTVYLQTGDGKKKKEEEAISDFQLGKDGTQGKENKQTFETVISDICWSLINVFMEVVTLVSVL